MRSFCRAIVASARSLIDKTAYFHGADPRLLCEPFVNSLAVFAVSAAEKDGRLPEAKRIDVLCP